MLLTHDSNVSLDGVQNYAHLNTFLDDILLMAQYMKQPMLNSLTLLPRMAQLFAKKL
jgi:hypothetical protein